MLLREQMQTPATATAAAKEIASYTCRGMAVLMMIILIVWNEAKVIKYVKRNEVHITAVTNK